MEEKYWNHYYSKSKERAAPIVPSQFATFVANEVMALNPLIVDLGCGNGRDTFFFSNYGFEVLGVDASESAIRSCEARLLEADKTAFLCADLADPSLAGKIGGFAGSSPVVLYARFFLHAIDERTEDQFFKLAQSICGSTGAVAAEFRTHKDEALSKVTDAHYRRFINPIEFLERASSCGFSSKYFVEGFGYAKFGNDDAHVARTLLFSNGTSLK